MPLTRAKRLSSLARETFVRFRDKCGASVCGDLKGRNGGPVLCECEDCCRNAVRALEEALASART